MHLFWQGKYELFITNLLSCGTELFGAGVYVKRCFAALDWIE